RGDYKKVTQNTLKEYDYLWKVLVYGNYLDFNLIKKLKSNFSSIKDIVKMNSFLVGRGIKIGGSDRNDVSKYIGKTLIDSRNDIKSFWINTNTLNKWEHSVVD